jgi:hypothetical protein
MVTARSYRRDKGYNIKLPRNFRDRFSRPYDKFLSALLGYSDMLTHEIKLTSKNQVHSGPKDWLVWLNDKDQINFMHMKQLIMPSATNPQFINALLIIHESRNIELNAARWKMLPQIECNLQSQMVKQPHVISKFPFIHESEHLNNVENNQNAELWSQGKKNTVLLPAIAKYPRTSIVKHAKTPSYKINGIELLQAEVFPCL